MKPFIHSKNSARKHGGLPEDYIDIHNFIDSTKVAIPDVRHRAVLHNAFGCFLVEGEEWQSEYGDDYMDTYELTKESAPKGLLTDIKTLFRNLPDDCMEMTFGDHVEVTSTRDGFQVDEYEHS